MAKDNSIVIQNDGKGIGASAYVGFEEIRNLNISDKPGIFFINERLDRASAAKGAGAAVVAKINWTIRGYRSADAKVYYYAIDEDGQIYRLVPSTGLWVLVAGNNGSFGPGLSFWKDYLMSARTSYLEAYNIETSTWENDWEAIDDQSKQHPMIAGSDDILWGGAGKHIFKCQENDGYTFAPGTSASYTFTKQALDLPSGYTVRCLAEFNEYLLIGTENINNANVAEIFVWDRTSTSWSKTIKINNSDTINWMEVYNNRIYIQAGNRGEIFVSDSTNVYPFAKIPATLIDDYSGLAFYPDASMIFNNKLYFAPSADTGANVVVAGVYSVDLDTGMMAVENTISTGETGENERLRITSMIAKGATNYYVAWQDDNTTDFGIDTLSTTNYVYGGSEAYFISQFINVGTSRQPKAFSSAEIQLSKDLTTGQSVTLSYRTDQGAGWTSIGTLTYSATTAQSSAQFDFGKPVQNLQIKAVFDASSTSVASPEMLFIRII